MDGAPIISILHCKCVLKWIIYACCLYFKWIHARVLSCECARTEHREQERRIENGRVRCRGIKWQVPNVFIKFSFLDCFILSASLNLKSLYLFLCVSLSHFPHLCLHSLSRLLLNFVSLHYVVVTLKCSQWYFSTFVLFCHFNKITKRKTPLSLDWAKKKIFQLPSNQPKDVGLVFKK